jgi:molecular chaperone GrpE
MTTERENERAEAREAAEAGDPADARDTTQADDSVDGLRAQLQEEREKAQSYYASWQRSAADFQNYKRRVEEERAEAARLANAALIINLLPIMDDLERALSTVDSHLAGLTWVDGIRLIHRKFQAVLEMSGVQEIHAEGRMFDPAQHEAVSQAPGDEGKVVAVVQKGYRLGDRVIRPAMVVVGSGEGEVKELEAE